MINPWRWRPRVMKQIQRRKAKGRVAQSVLRLPDLEVAKSAVLNSLSCPDAQRGYRHAIDEFVDWYCSEPRSSFSKICCATLWLSRRRMWNRSIGGWNGGRPGGRPRSSAGSGAVILATSEHRINVGPRHPSVEAS